MSRLPNLFVVGAAKAGTTTLWGHLAAHPEVFMAAVKEPHFFSPLFGGSKRIASEDEYLALFLGAGCRPVVGEASTSYLPDQRAAAAIAARCPDSRIVISLRDPVARAYSSYWMARGFGVERRTFGDAAREEVAAGLVIDGRPWPHVAQSLYAASVRRYRELFPYVHVLVFEELVARPREVLAELFAFLGVDPQVAEELEPRRDNPHTEGRIALVDRMIRTAPVRRAGAALPEPVLRSAQRLLRRPAETPPIDPETAAFLEEVFRDDVQEVETLLGRPAPWPRFQ